MKYNFLIVMLLVISTLVFIGCTDKNESSEEVGNKFVFTKNEFPPKVPGYIMVGNKRYKMEEGNYEWNKDNTTIRTDHAGPTQIAESFKSIQVKPSEKIRLELKQNPLAVTYVWDDEDGSEYSDDTEFTAPADEGIYIFETVAKWSNGEVSYTFVLEVNE